MDLRRSLSSYLEILGIAFLVLSFIGSLGSSHYGVYFWSKSLSIPADRIGAILVGGQLGFTSGYGCQRLSAV